MHDVIQKLFMNYDPEFVSLHGKWLRNVSVNFLVQLGTLLLYSVPLYNTFHSIILSGLKFIFTTSMMH